jgi:hypothetical protein
LSRILSFVWLGTWSFLRLRFLHVAQRRSDLLYRVDLFALALAGALSSPLSSEEGRIEGRIEDRGRGKRTGERIEGKRLEDSVVALPSGP